MSAPGADPLLGTFSGATPGTMRNISTSYAVLALVHLALGVAFLAFPQQVAWLVFNVHHGKEFKASDLEYLIRLASTAFFIGAAVSWALKCASDQRSLGSTDAQRLKGGLMVFSPLVILLLVLYHKHISWWGLIIGGAAMLATFVIPFTAIGVADYRLLAANNMIQGVTSGFRTMFDFRATFSQLSSFCFALATLVFFIAGVIYLVLPTPSYQSVFGYKPHRDAIFLWRLIGITLVTLVPTLTFVLKEAADHAFLDSRVPTSVNAGFLLASLIHIIVFGYMLVTEHVRAMLVVLMITWILALIASLIGMVTAHSMASRDGTAGPLEQL